MRKNTVALLDGQTVQAVIAAKSLRKKGYRVVALCEEKWTYGYFSRWIDEKIYFPLMKDHSQLYLFLVEVIQKEKIDLLIPMNDNSAVFLSQYKDRLSGKTKFVIPDWEIFESAYDKNRLMHLCRVKGYPHPSTIDLSHTKVSEIGEAFHFPALLKPNISTGARGITMVNGRSELESMYPEWQRLYGDCHLQEFISPGGRQLKVQIMLDANGNLINSSVIHKQRFYPVKGGSSCCNTTIQDTDLVAICMRILKDLHWVGFADFDLLEDLTDGKIKVIEINPRIPACVKSATVSGVDYAVLIAELTMQEAFSNFVYRPGKTLRYIGFEILWFGGSIDRFKVRPNWLNFWGRDVYYQDLDWRDPLSFLMGTFGNIKKQLSPEFRKSKSGMN